jgi:hypothetical protein
MKKHLLVLLSLMAAGSVWAQSAATSGKLDFDAERARISTERAALESRSKTEQAACYQKFAVEGCLSDIRERNRKLTDDLKRQEAAINDIQRKQRGAAQLDRLDEKNATPRPQDQPAQREEAVKSQQEREQRAAEHAKSREDAAAKAAENKRNFESKQRAHADVQAKASQRAAEADQQRQLHERKLQKAAEHVADREKHNAERAKPRSAPLPAPAP